jgi:Na+/proline symporter
MFDMVDYRKRQRSIRRITIAALVITILTFLVVGFGWINDANTQTVLEFMSMSSFLVFLFGLIASFNAWFEKKFMQFRDKINERR